jgi:Ferredoxin
MKAGIDKDICIGCGNCEAICPDVFRMQSDGTAEVIVAEIPESLTTCAKKAEEGCPVQAIALE